MSDFGTAIGKFYKFTQDYVDQVWILDGPELFRWPKDNGRLDPF